MKELVIYLIKGLVRFYRKKVSIHNLRNRYLDPFLMDSKKDVLAGQDTLAVALSHYREVILATMIDMFQGLGERFIWSQDLKRKK